MSISRRELSQIAKMSVHLGGLVVREIMSKAIVAARGRSSDSYSKAIRLLFQELARPGGMCLPAPSRPGAKTVLSEGWIKYAMEDRGTNTAGNQRRLAYKQKLGTYDKMFVAFGKTPGSGGPATPAAFMMHTLLRRRVPWSHIGAGDNLWPPTLAQLKQNQRRKGSVIPEGPYEIFFPNDPELEGWTSEGRVAEIDLICRDRDFKTAHTSLLDFVLSRLASYTTKGEHRFKAVVVAMAFASDGVATRFSNGRRKSQLTLYNTQKFPAKPMLQDLFDFLQVEWKPVAGNGNGNGTTNNNNNNNGNGNRAGPSSRGGGGGSSRASSFHQLGVIYVVLKDDQRGPWWKRVLDRMAWKVDGDHVTAVCQIRQGAGRSYCV
jgi:hypothetical protein